MSEAVPFQLDGPEVANASMPSEHDQIAELEAEIERFHDAAERCRQIDLAAKLAIALGAVSLASAMLWRNPVALVVGFALLLGGLALYGSNRRTLDEIVARIRSTEARRAEVIEDLALRPVADMGG